MRCIWTFTFVLFGIYSWFILIIPDINLMLHKLFILSLHNVNMDNSSKSFLCFLLFCISCCYPYMLRLSLMNNFASVRYYNSCCIAGMSYKEVLHREPSKLVQDIFIIFHSWRTEELRISIPWAYSDTLAYFHVQYLKRVISKFKPICQWRQGIKFKALLGLKMFK